MATGTIKTIPDLKDYFFSAPNPITSRINIVNGGYVKFGALVIINIKVKAVATATNSPGIMTNIPRPRIESALSAIDITSGITEEITSSIPCGIADSGISGNVYMKEIKNNHIYAITGCYITAD